MWRLSLQPTGSDATLGGQLEKWLRRYPGWHLVLQNQMLASLMGRLPKLSLEVIDVLRG